LDLSEQKVGQDAAQSRWDTFSVHYRSGDAGFGGSIAVREDSRSGFPIWWSIEIEIPWKFKRKYKILFVRTGNVRDMLVIEGHYLNCQFITKGWHTLLIFVFNKDIK
jgi:hypothetical protein